MGILCVCAGLIIIIVSFCHFVLKDKSCMIAPIIIVVIAGTILCLGIPGDFVSEHLAEEIKIASLSNIEQDYAVSTKYLSRSRNGVVSYIRITSDSNGNSSWEVQELPKDALIVIIEDNDVSEPVLRIYESGYMRNFWTFSLLGNNKTYVFKLPKESGLPIYESAE